MADLDNLAGKIVDGWTLEAVLGRGADGIVYSGRSAEGRLAAVKLFLPESLKKNGAVQAGERLELQLNLVGKKLHPHLVEIYGGGTWDEHNTLYLSMEFVPGSSLDKVMAEIPRDCVPALLGQLASAARFLEEELELFHRDIKPANIVVSDDFSTLTLLDLGIVYRLPDDDDGRLSGAEFVATTRYSPHEFVWRTEEGGEDGAWRAITFYQLGATLHDMLVGKPLFHGQDQPRARLYDCVRYQTPQIPDVDGQPWLSQLARACLLKDWRLRLQFVTWDSFFDASDDTGVVARQKSIRLKQARKEEARLAAEKHVTIVASNSREQDLWRLNAGLFGELRTYLLGSPIFPKFRADETMESEHEYRSRFEFDADQDKNFETSWKVSVCVSVAKVAKEATELRFAAQCGDKTIIEATWTEMFTVDTAFSNCQQALLDAADSLLS